MPYFLKCDINAVNVVILQNILNGNFSNFLIKGHPRTGVPTMSIERQLTKFQYVEQIKAAPVVGAVFSYKSVILKCFPNGSFSFGG